MNKQVFGKLVTYKGRSLTKAKSLKQNDGDLVFAEITGSTDLDLDHEDYGKDGYYIYAGGASAHLVNFNTFKTLKDNVGELNKKLDGINTTVIDYVNSVISNLDTVMEFIGVTEIEITNGSIVKPTDLYINDAEPKKGDVIVYKSKEFVWDGTSWREIGQVKADEAVTSLGGKKGDILLGEGLSIDELDGIKTLNVNIPDVPEYSGENAIDITDYKVTLKTSDNGNVTLTNDVNGLSANVNTENISYSTGETESTVTNVKEALDEIFNDERVIAASLVDLNERVDNINDKLDNLNQTTIIDGDDEDYISISESTTESGGKEYTISASVISGQDSTGLATDGYVHDAINNSFIWNNLND